MRIKSDAPIYEVIERHLRGAANPLSSVELWDTQDVRDNARSAEKVSDFLGHMWRRGLIQRWAVSKNSLDRARYAYSWIEETEAEKPRKIEHLKIANTRLIKSNVTITEEHNRIVLDFELFTLIVQAKG